MLNNIKIVSKLIENKIDEDVLALAPVREIYA